MKGNFSKAISGVLVPEWVGVDSFGRGLGTGVGVREVRGVASIPHWMVKSAAQQKCIPRFFLLGWVGGVRGRGVHEFHDYQVLWLVCGFGLV